MSANLERLTLTIETRLAAIDEALGPRDPQSPKFYEALKARESAYRGLIDDLVTIECAKFRHAMDAGTLTLAGVRASATGGHHALLRNWINAARRRIAADKAVEA